MLAETPVTQRSPCYSAVSALLTNLLPDCSNYSPFYHTHYLTPDQYFSLVSSGQTLYQAAPLETNASLLLCFTVESSWNSGEMRKLNNKQRQVSMFLILLFKLLPQFPFVSFLSTIYPLSTPFSTLSLFSLSTIPYCFSDQLFVLLR